MSKPVETLTPKRGEGSQNRVEFETIAERWSNISISYHSAMNAPPPLRRIEIAVLMISVLIVAISGIAYELIIAAVSSYLIGNGVLQFSLTIGLFMLAMGIGSLLSQRIGGNLIGWFVAIELALSMLGGWSTSLLFWAYPGYTMYRPVSWALILSIGTLVGLEIPLLTRILSTATTWRSAIANVLSLDYFGALVGSVAFPLFLLPTLGLFQSSLGVALLNVLVAIGTLIPLGHHLRGRVIYWIASTAVVVCLAAGLAGSNWLEDRAEAQLFASNIVYRQQTPYQRIIVTRNGRDDEIRLYLDGHLQFAGNDEHRYHESLVHPAMSIPMQRSEKNADGGARVLVLGGGDGLAVRELLKFPQIGTIDLVDIDPAMTQLANRFAPLRKLNRGALTDPSVTIHHTDAFSFVRDAGSIVGGPSAIARPYDRVIIDLPDPHNEALSKLYSVEFYKLLRRIIAEDAVIVCQSSSPVFTRRAYWCVKETMVAAGYQTHSYTIPIASFGPWGFHLASPSRLPEIIKIDDRKTRYLTTEVLRAAATFGGDESPLPVVANRLFEPTIYLYYVEELTASR